MRVAAGIIAILVCSLVSGAASARVGEGTVPWALAQPDGTRVDLPHVLVWSTEKGWFTLYEMGMSLRVLSDAPVEAHSAYTIRGTITSTAQGRALTDAVLWVMVDQFGRPIPFPFPKTVSLPKGWQFVRFWPEEGMSAMGEEPPVPPGGDPPPPPPASPPPEGSIALARTLPNGSWVTLRHKVVTADRSDFANHVLYVEEANRSAGIRITYWGSAQAVRDATVDVTGTMNTLSSGERWIEAGATGVTLVTPGEPVPTPLGQPNRSLGGGDVDALTVGVTTPAGFGLYNIGLLVKSWGKVTYVDSTNKFLYVDDGSTVNGLFDDGTGHGTGMAME